MADLHTRQAVRCGVAMFPGLRCPLLILAALQDKAFQFHSGFRREITTQKPTGGGHDD